MNGQQRKEEKIITKFNKVNITLFECQIDLLLDSLVVYSYDTNEKYNNRKLAKSKAEDSEKALIKDTYYELMACKRENNQKEQFIP